MLLLASVGAMGCGTDDSFTPIFNQPNPPNPPNLVVKEFVLTPNLNAGSVSVRSINLSTGQTQLVSTPAAGTQPTMVRVHPTRNHFYVSNVGSSNITGGSINTDGSTAVLPGSPYTGPAGGRNVHIHPSGNFLYVAGAAVLQSFQINADGSLTSLGTTATGFAPRNDGVFTPDGQFLHIPVVDGIQTFSINTGTGVATATTHTTITGAAPVNDISISPDGTLLLVDVQVAGANNDRIAPFTVGAAGALTAQPVNNLSFDVGLGQFAKNGIYYVGDLADANARVFGFTVSNVGLLNGITGSPFTAPGGGSQTAPDKTDNFIFSAAQGSSMTVSKKQADNTLQLSTGSPFTDGITGPFIFDFYQVSVPQ
jgi:6-phosphogluconolactonase (cycloisomerase 2 family)